MYYILNETDQIVAADGSFLILCGVTHINELSSKIARGDIDLDFSEEKQFSLSSNDNTEKFHTKKTSLSSLIGQLTLVALSTEENQETLSTDENIEDTALIDALLTDKESIEKDEVSEAPLISDEAEDIFSLEEPEEEITLGDHLNLEDDSEMMTLNEETSEEEEEPLVLSKEPEEAIEVEDGFDEDALFGMDLEDKMSEEPLAIETEDEPITQDEAPLEFSLKDDSESIQDDILFDAPAPQVDISEIVIDIAQTSQNIGISSEDYSNFLNEFIDTALGLEKDLQHHDKTTKDNAVATLMHLSQVLHLPQIGDIIHNIGESSDDSQRTLIESFYGTLSRITTTQAPVETEEVLTQSPVIEEDLTLDTAQEEKLELFDESEAPIEKESIQPAKAKSENSFGTISLEGIKPKHFDFQLEEAANDLSLPVELIEEFVHDFIQQALIETENMLKAYEEGDLDAIQKIGHLLKGASSNLRINPLSDTLYQIQFCEDSNNLEALIKDYWAHFLSFENQINVISN